MLFAEARNGLMYWREGRAVESRLLEKQKSWERNREERVRLLRRKGMSREFVYSKGYSSGWRRDMVWWRVAWSKDVYVEGFGGALMLLA